VSADGGDMTSLVGNISAQAAFGAAVNGVSLHHAWLFVGPQGVGKASFAHMAALRMLADAAHPGSLPPGFAVPAGHPTRALVAAGSHPDFKLLSRLPKDSEKPDQDLARSITIAQVRTLQGLFATTPSMSPRRVVVIDAADDLERGGANALLKSLEEPPAGTIFILISHAAGRLLPTIRSRCRLLRFEALATDQVAEALRRQLPDSAETDIAALAQSADGAPGRALRHAGFDIAGIDRALAAIAERGDPDNGVRIRLARSLSGKAAAGSYAAFLDLAPSFIARQARTRSGVALRTALDAHHAARELAAAAPGLSLDPQATVFEMAGIVARLR
jgi:DNA polymerase-3 subunit delta'